MCWHALQLCIPVMHEGHWTLYAFNMDDEKVSILDHKRHKSIRLKICKALERAKSKSYMFKRKSGNFSCWKYEFVKVTRNEKRCLTFLMYSIFLMFTYCVCYTVIYIVLLSAAATLVSSYSTTCYGGMAVNSMNQRCPV